MTRIISIVNHKGGVAKTTTTLNFGKALSMEGLKTLIIDLDPQANLSQSVGIEDPEVSIYHALNYGYNLPIQPIGDNFDLVPSDLELASSESKLQADQLKGYLALRKALQPIKEEYDYIIIDCPPSLGVLTNNALMASNEVLITISSQILPTKGMDNILAAVEFAKEFNEELKIAGILITLHERTIAGQGVVEQVKVKYPGQVYDTMIRKNVAIQEAAISNMDIFSYDQKSSGAQDYMSFTKEVLVKSENYGG